MKKIITISIIFALLLSASAWEMVYSSCLYEDIFCGLRAVEQSMEQNQQDISNPTTVELMDKVARRWKKGREVVFCMGNHTVLRNIDEKLISLQAMIATNHKEDAAVAIKVTLSLIDAIKNDTHPVVSNLF